MKPKPMEGDAWIAENLGADAPVHTVSKGTGSSQCTRCGRAIKNIFIVDGAPYGPICVKKLFGIDVLAGLGYKLSAPAIALLTEEPINQPPIDFGSVSYHGRILDEDERVIIATRNGVPEALGLRLDLSNHSPTGFCWGYAGSGPAQAALAILADYLGDDQRALLLHQDFKARVLAGLPMDQDFNLDSEAIETAITLINIDRMKNL